MCSICLSIGDRLVAHRETQSANRHSEWLGQYIADCLSEAHLEVSQLSAVSVSGGPGSYTGLRVGVSTAKAICYAQDIPLIAIDSLHALALYASTIHDCDLIVPMMDARRMEVYLAEFSHDGQRISPDRAQILSENLFKADLTEDKRIVICGNGTQKAAPLFENQGIQCDLSLGHSSIHLIQPATQAFQARNFVDPFQYTPGYLKAPNITTPKKSII